MSYAIVFSEISSVKMSKKIPLAALLYAEVWCLHQPELYEMSLLEMKDGKEFKSMYPVPDYSAIQFIDSKGNKAFLTKEESNLVPEKSIGLIPITGEIVPYGDWCTVGADDIAQQFMEAFANENIDAVIMPVDSPGGAVKAIDILKSVKDSKNKPIIALVRDALSLALWTVAELADYVIANGNVSPRFGSVGVVTQMVKTDKAMERLGYEIKTYYPPESNLKNKDQHDALNDKPDGLIKNVLSPLAQRFQEAMREGFPNLKEKDGILNGAVVFADKAIELGICDEIGNLDTAIAVARKLALQNAVSQGMSV